MLEGGVRWVGNIITCFLWAMWPDFWHSIFKPIHFSSASPPPVCWIIWSHHPSDTPQCLLGVLLGYLYYGWMSGLHSLDQSVIRLNLLSTSWIQNCWNTITVAWQFSHLEHQVPTFLLCILHGGMDQVGSQCPWHSIEGHRPKRCSVIISCQLSQWFNMGLLNFPHRCVWGRPRLVLMSGLDLLFKSISQQGTSRQRP